MVVFAAAVFVGPHHISMATLTRTVASAATCCEGCERAMPSQLQARREPRALRTGFRRMPMPETSTSQTSPCFIALVEPGVPV